MVETVPGGMSGRGRIILYNKYGCHILMAAVVRNKVVLPEKTWLASNQVSEWIYSSNCP